MQNGASWTRGVVVGGAGYGMIEVRAHSMSPTRLRLIPAFILNSQGVLHTTILVEFSTPGKPQRAAFSPAAGTVKPDSKHTKDLLAKAGVKYY